jgi:hypothetical protein
MMKKIRIMLLLTAVLLAAGCAKSNIEVFRFVNQSVVIQNGQSEVLQLIFGEYNTDSEVTYTLSEQDIIILNGNTATAINPGEVTVTATIDNVKFARMYIKVINEPLSGMKINGPDILTVGNSATLTVDVFPPYLQKDVVWSIEDSEFSDKTGATITANGVVTALRGADTAAEQNAEGVKVIVVATSIYDPTMSVKKLIKIQYKPTLTVSFKQGSVISMNIGDTLQLEVQVTPINAAHTFTFTSKAPGTAEVDAAGVVTALTVGSCDVTVRTMDKKTATIIINVVDPTPVNPEGTGE